MKGLKLKWPGTGRLRRAVLTLGAVGACVGGMLLIAAPAQAVIGTDTTLGTVQLSPTSGTASTTTTWGTSDGCKSGFQDTAALYENSYTSPGTYILISGVINLSGSSPIAAGQTFIENLPVLSLLADAGVPDGGSTEWFVKCSSLGSDSGTPAAGTAVYWQDIEVNLNPAGTEYTVSTPVQAQNTSTTLSASPSSESASSTSEVTLTATITAADGTDADGGGTVTFYNGTTVLNPTAAPVTWSTTSPITGTATTETTFPTAGTFSLTATFTPSNTSAYNASTSAALGYTVYTSGTGTAGTVSVSVAVPATGAFTVTVPTGTATLTPNSTAGSTTPATSATGSLGAVLVSETRNSQPGWAVYGEETTNFTSTTTSFTIPSDNLGWQPEGSVEGGATLGLSETDIGTTAGAAVLAQALAGAGYGTDSLNPTLTLTLPTATPPDTFTGTVTITYIETAP